MVDEVEPAESPGGDQLLYELARWHLDEQTGRIDALDRKLAATFTLNGALIALFAAAFAFRGDGISQTVWAMIVAVVAVFLANAICAFLAFRLRSWEMRPDLDALERVAEEFSVVEARSWAAREMWSAFQENEADLAEKALWLRRATALTMIDLGMAGVAAVVATWPW